MLRGLLAVLALFALPPAAAYANECVGPIPTKRRVLRNHVAVFAGRVVATDPPLPVRFQVTERFAGKLGPYVEILPSPGNLLRYDPGRQYLVFADRCPWECGKGCLTSDPCGGARPLETAPALVRQLRADRSGKPMASVYGRLIYREWENQDRPLPGIVVRLHGAGKSFETRTDDQGVYAFEQLKGGTYRVSAGLPPDMEIAEQFGRAAEPLELPSRSSLEHDIYAFPTGRIAGTVIGPDGKPVRSAMVGLCRADHYREAKAERHSFQGPHGPRGDHWTPFAFDRLPAGDYLLVFNDADSVEWRTPYRRTFYPRAARVEDAQVIHLAAGRQITNADILLGAPAAVREITVRIAWSGREPAAWVPVGIVAEGRGTRTWMAEPSKDHPHTYTLPLWQSERYSIQASIPCHTGGAETAKTNAVAVDGNDLSISEITLTFDRHWCGTK